MIKIEVIIIGRNKNIISYEDNLKAIYKIQFFSCHLLLAVLRENVHCLTENLWKIS